MFLRTFTLGALIVVSVTACGQNEQAGQATAPAAAASQTAATPAVTIRNAYLSNALDGAGNPGTPLTSVKAGEKAYVGAVILGNATEATVKFEWWDSAGKQVGAAESKIPVNGAGVAKADMTAEAPLAPGKYSALVSVDGVTGWQLDFQVN